METLNLETLVIARGGHKDRSNGLCVMEAVAFLAKEPHSDHPECTCPVIAAYTRILNDFLGDKDRQRLKSYIPRLLNTNSSLDIKVNRAKIASEFSKKFAKYATKYAAESAKYAESAAKYAEYAAEYAAESAAESAKYAAKHDNLINLAFECLDAMIECK
jgi:hypothetical protein